MFFKYSLINQVQITIPMIPMLLCLCTKQKVTTKKTIWLLNQWHAMMATFFIFSMLEISIRYTLYINMLNVCFISCVLKIISSKGCWFIKILFSRFLNLSLAIPHKKNKLRFNRELRKIIKNKQDLTEKSQENPL